eukprot:TRINITY_DN1706_c0_g1_i9.p1 TRINITY_DN1706_c0_g1~~TRINITY_DN1706_c0_g1_i9.p1  ORF type:complete len:383 (-),score=99.20 TRINITY_DN1706_c0_g1_i9:38-1138(-)
MKIFCLLFVGLYLSLAQAGPKDGYTCDTNNWDGHQWCLCKPGERVASIHSEHSNHNEDRKWTLTCGAVQPEFIVENENSWYEVTSPNGWDGELWWQGTPENKFLVGMTSEHDNHHEDRQFRFFTVYSDNWYVTDCIWHTAVNNLDGVLDWTLGADEVFAGLHSIHHNHQEDRIWDLQVCKLRKKCTEITSIEYETVASDVSSEEVFAGHGQFDNTNGASDNSLTVSISQTAGQSLTESYSYSQSSGYENEISMSVTAGYKVGFPMIDEFSLEVTVGASSTWNFEETWTRSNSKTYSEENGRTMTFTSNCKAGCLCEMDVIVTTASGVVPYTMRSQSVDGKYTCEEKGELKVDYSFDGRAVENDQCS